MRSFSSWTGKTVSIWNTSVTMESGRIFPHHRVVKDFRDYYPESLFDPVVPETVYTSFEQERPLS